jgi:hypothetical protein
MRAEAGFLLRGLLAYLPWYHRRLKRRAHTGGTDSGRYCYSVWLRHLSRLRQHGWGSPLQNVAELGPGDSVGVGLAALLCGAERYVALDVFPYTDRRRWLAMLGELFDLFARRSPIPDEAEFPEIRPRLETYDYPEHLLGGARLDATRLSLLRREVGDPSSERIRYVCPWFDAAQVRPESIDLLISQAVMEHVTHLETAYGASFAWLKAGGYASHIIDFSSHGVSGAWNGHWRYPEGLWRLAVARREFTMNRQPLSVHLELARRVGFEVVHCQREVRGDGLPHHRLARPFRDFSAADRRAIGAHLILRKPSAMQ